MSSLESAIVWTDRSYSMRELVDGYGHSFPLLCRTTGGYLGCEETTLGIGYGEIFWIFEVHRQERLVVQASKTDCYLSIPIAHPVRVQLQQERGKKYGQPMSIRRLMDVMNSRSPSALKMIFENNRKVSFQIEADMVGSAKFDTLITQKLYDEKYLLAYSVVKGMIFSWVQAIPVYMPVAFSVAKGFVDGDAEEWSNWTKNIAQLTKTFNPTAFRTTQEIILFNERPSDGDYEYIKLSDFSKFKTKDIKFSSEIVKQETETEHGNNSSQLLDQSGVSEPSGGHWVPVPRLPPLRPRPRDSDGKNEKPTMKSLVRALPPIPSGGNVDDFSIGPLRSVAKVLKNPEVVTPEPYESLHLAASSSSGRVYASLSEAKVLTNPEAVTQEPYESLNLAASSSSGRVYASLSEVPVDLDFSQLTVDDVVDQRHRINGNKICGRTDKI